MADNESLIILYLLFMVIPCLHCTSVHFDPVTDPECVKGCHGNRPGISCSVSHVNCDSLFMSGMLDPITAGDYPSKPEGFNPVELPVKSDNANNARLNITWKIPNDVSYKYVRGFLIQVAPMSGSLGQTQCVYFNMSDTKWEEFYSEARQLQFYYPCVPVYCNQKYFTQLYSVPLPSDSLDNSVQNTKTTSCYKSEPTNRVTRNTAIPVDPAFWETTIFHAVTNVDSVDGAWVNVTFKLAPFKVTTYIVRLELAADNSRYINESKVTVDPTHNKETATVIFKGVSEGSYRIRVYPERENTDKSCACGEEGDFIPECISCLRTLKLFNVSKDLPIAPSESSTPDQQKMTTERPSNSTVVPVSIAAVVALVVIVLVAIFIVWHKRNKKTDKEPNTETPAVIPKPIGDDSDEESQKDEGLASFRENVDNGSKIITWINMKGDENSSKMSGDIVSHNGAAV